jgi:hypothetical protein
LDDRDGSEWRFTYGIRILGWRYPPTHSCADLPACDESDAGFELDGGS